MPRPYAFEYSAGLSHYLDLVPERDIVPALEAQAPATMSFLRRFSEENAGQRYAEGKWSVKEVLGHMGDSERVFAYRAMAIARGDDQPLPGYDEQIYARHGRYDSWSLADLVANLGLLRHSTVVLFRNMPPEAWDRQGLANNRSISVRALGYLILGHERHHLRVLAERYTAA